MSRAYDLQRQSWACERANNQWLKSQGIDTDQLIRCDHARDLGFLLEAKAVWQSVVETDRAYWLALWYRVYQRNRPLTDSQRQRYRNLLKRATRLARRK